MALKNVIPFILMLTHVSSCLARSGDMFSPGFVSASKSLPSWPILSAGTSVTVALVLSLFLTFEHLCAYHQPEEQKFMIGLILMVPVYAVQSVSRQAAQLLLFFIPTFLHKKLPLCFLNLFTLHVIVVILKSENLNA